MHIAEMLLFHFLQKVAVTYFHRNVTTQ